MKLEVEEKNIENKFPKLKEINKEEIEEKLEAKKEEVKKILNSRKVKIKGYWKNVQKSQEPENLEPIKTSVWRVMAYFIIYSFLGFIIETLINPQKGGKYYGTEIIVLPQLRRQFGC